MPELGTYGSVRGVPSNGHSYRDRQFSNRRQVGACVGLVPQPYDSGESHTDQGISRQGSRRVRALLVEMAWCWLRYQPDSALTQWFNQRTQGTGPNRRTATSDCLVALSEGRRDSRRRATETSVRQHGIANHAINARRETDVWTV